MIPRMFFLIVCAATLLMANGVRAYGIIVGNYLGIAAGADHRLFSYAIYGLTMPLLFWAALQWKQSDALDSVAVKEDTSPFDRRKAILLSLCSLGLLLLARLVVSIKSASV